MNWILILFWSLHGEPVLNHEVFEAQAPCEERIAALRKVFEYLDHSDWFATCQIEKSARLASADDKKP